jgi:peptidoglycan hydrolase CwlO-like protein|tara:strand:- start:5560 stop:5796 length:237 start_codon:yes stop_codon:yes gene_type:complete
MTKKEIKELNEYVSRYREIQLSLDLMQKSIESLAKKRDGLFEEVDSMKLKEKKFMDKIVKKYGASEVTPNKLLQYIKE